MNEDPKKYSYLNSIISPVDYEVVIDAGQLPIVEETTIANTVVSYQLDKDKIYKAFPKRYVSIKDFESSLEITHRFDYDGERLTSLTIEFSSAYDETKLKRIYEIIAKDIRNKLTD